MIGARRNKDGLGWKHLSDFGAGCHFWLAQLAQQ
jgi:hypothetical protein